MGSITDQLKRELHFDHPPCRIVSLVPSQTELLVDLGLEGNLVGITKFCVHPVHLRKQKKIVGGTKKVNFEKIKEVSPDIILCNKEENTKEMVGELEKIAPVHVSEIKTIPHSLELISQYGQLFEVEDMASVITGKIEKGLKELQDHVREKPTKKVAYFIWRKPWMVAGKDTFIDHLLSLNQLENIFTEEISRYPEIALSQLRSKNVELVLLSTEPFPFKERHKEELQKLLGNSEIQIVDGEAFSWYGSRMIKSFKYFRKIQL